MRRFDQPQRYKPFVRRCVVRGDIEIGSVRQIDVKSGLPATTSTEQLELFNEDEHVLGFKILGGDHRLQVRDTHSDLDMLQSTTANQHQILMRRCIRNSRTRTKT